MTLPTEASSSLRARRKWRTATSGIALLLSILSASAPVRADVQALHWYRMGDEVTPYPVFGSDIPVLHDWIGGLDLQGSEPYGKLNYGPSNSGLRAFGATFTSRYSLTNSTSCYQADALPEVEDFGFEAWVFPTDSAGSGCIASNGVTGVNGWSISYDHGKFVAHAGSVTLTGAAPRSNADWTHLALVRTGGTTRFVQNGTSMASSKTPIPKATGHFAIGAIPPATTGGSSASPFAGQIDEARYFKITGTFSLTADLLYLPARMRVTAIPQSDLVTKRAIDLGTLKTGATVSAAFTVEEGSVSTPDNWLVISNITLSGPDAAEFTLRITPQNLDRGLYNRLIEIYLTPKTPGPKSATVTVATNDPFFSPLNIALTANAVASPVIEVLEGSNGNDQALASNGTIQTFPSTARNQASSQPKTFTIHNSGATSLSLASVSVAGADSSSFVITSAPSTGSLGAGESTAFTVNFIPTATAGQRADIIIKSDATNLPVFQIPVSGVTAGPAIQVSGPSGELLASGRVLSWGDNSLHQCDTPEGLGKITAIATGYNHTLGIRADGTVAAWGWDLYGQCDVPAGLGGVIAVSGGFGHSLALRSDHTVVAWGKNDEHQCDVPSGLADVAAISAGHYHSTALKTDGTVVEWGDPTVTTAIPADLTGVTSIVSGNGFTIAVESDGHAVSWPAFYNSTYPNLARLESQITASPGKTFSLLRDGSLGDWSSSKSPSLPPTTSSPFVGISSNRDLMAAIHADGSLALFLPFGTTTSAPERGELNIPPGQRFTSAVACGENSFLATLSDSFVNFGALDRHRTGAPQLFTITNSGSATLHLSGASLPGDGAAAYLLDSSELASTLAPGESTHLTVALSMQAAGTENARLEIESDDPGCPTFTTRLMAQADVFAVSYIDWKMKYFGTLQENAGDSADDADANGNGIPNLLEYALGGNPIKPGSSVALLPTIHFGSIYGFFSFPMVPGLNGVILTVQGSNTLAENGWTDIAISTEDQSFNSLTPSVGWTFDESLPGSGVYLNWFYNLPYNPSGAPPYRFIRLKAARN